MLLVCTGLSGRRGVVLMVPDNSAIFSSASTNFFCVALSSAVKLALVAVSLAVVARLLQLQLRGLRLLGLCPLQMPGW